MSVREHKIRKSVIARIILGGLIRLDDDALILDNIDRLFDGISMLIEQIDCYSSVENIQRRDIISVRIHFHLHTEAGAADCHRRLWCAHLIHRVGRKRLRDLIQDRSLFQDDDRLVVRWIPRCSQFQTGIRLHQDKFGIIEYHPQRAVRIGHHAVAALQIHSGIGFQIPHRSPGDDRSADHFKYLDDTVFIRPVFQDDPRHHRCRRHDQSCDPQEQLAVQ